MWCRKNLSIDTHHVLFDMAFSRQRKAFDNVVLQFCCDLPLLGEGQGGTHCPYTVYLWILYSIPNGLDNVKRNLFSPASLGVCRRNGWHDFNASWPTLLQEWVARCKYVPNTQEPY